MGIPPCVHITRSFRRIPTIIPTLLITTASWASTTEVPHGDITLSIPPHHAVHLLQMFMIDVEHYHGTKRERTPRTLLQIFMMLNTIREPKGKETSFTVQGKMPKTFESCVCVCVCLRERERERECVYVWERETKRERERECVCLRERDIERERECVFERER